MNFRKLAERHSLTCFMNSLLRERFNFSFNENDLIFHLSEFESLKFPLSKKSELGRHHYTGKIFHSDFGVEKELCFIDAARLIAQSLIKNPEHSESLTDIFIHRLENSIDNIESSLKVRQSDISSLYSSDSLSFEAAEQGLFIGHNFHPYPKMREGFDDDDYTKYSPEMGAHFQLVWLAIRSDRLKKYYADTFTDHSWNNQLAAQEKFQVPNGYEAFPMHPWQFKTLKDQGLLDEHFVQENAVILGEGQLNWFPTSSLRSVYSPDAKYMLKFSLSLKLTNSIRHLTDVEVVRGMQVYDVMNSPSGKEFQKQHSNFHVISEPSFLGLIDTDGQLLNETLVVARENPFNDTTKNNIVVSTLAQDHPFFETNLIATNIQKYANLEKIKEHDAAILWFEKYLECCVLPLIDGQANYGFFLGAHQQNLIIELKNHLPVRGLFRDCQGTGYNELGYALYSPFVSSLTRENGNIVNEMGNILLGYYLFINSSFNIIAAIADLDSVSESELLEILKNKLTAARKANPKDSTFLDYLLSRPEIYHKGNFYCSIENINENTAANPLAIYNLIPNPLFLGE